MIPELDMLVLLVATIVGALTSSALGWSDAGGAFDIKKYWPSIVRAAISAIVVFTATYSGFIGEVNLFTVLFAFLAGMGLDAGGNRLAGTIARVTQ